MGIGQPVCGGAKHDIGNHMDKLREWLKLKRLALREGGGGGAHQSAAHMSVRVYCCRNLDGSLGQEVEAEQGGKCNGERPTSQWRCDA